MNIGLFVTMIVIVILTIAIFLLVFFTFSVIYHDEKRKIDNGEEDQKMVKENGKRDKKSKIGSFVTDVVFLLCVLSLAGMTVYSRISLTKGQMLDGTTTSMVIASNSMATSNSKNLYLTEEMRSEEFSRGDIVKLKSIPKDFDLDVSAYKYKIFVYWSPVLKENVIHRLIGVSIDTGGQICFVFRGDANSGSDVAVRRTALRAEYDGVLIDNIGIFVLFLQSGFGIYSVCSSVCLFLLLFWYGKKTDKLCEKRLVCILEKEGTKCER